MRPPEIIAVLKAEAFGEPYDQEAFIRHLRTAVAEVVRRQAEAGVDIPSDGEFGKVGWNNYVLERFSGLELRELPPGATPLGRGKDRREFADFYAVWNQVERTIWLPPEVAQAVSATGTMTARWVCTGPIRYKGHAAIQRDIANFKTALAAAGIAEGFLPVAAPGSVEASHPNEYYPSDEAYLYAIADALREEYRAIVDADLLLQVDDAFLPYVYDWMVDRASLTDYLKYCEVRVEALNYALRGLAEERVRYHICWGSWNGPHSTDVPLRDIVHLVLKVNAGAYSIEAANPRHEHEWKVWRDVKLPEGKVLIPGVVTPLHQYHRAPGAGGGPHRALFQPGRAGERDRRHRLRFLPTLELDPHAPVHSMGKAAGAGGGCSARLAGAVGKNDGRRRTASVGLVPLPRPEHDRLPPGGATCYAHPDATEASTSTGGVAAPAAPGYDQHAGE